ncbi:shufflon system plasmid conjugative transfer pilus tip adhesin PilV [Salmonella enterica]|nr:shufflon system plasmid conjugative transfer pilus tip adhesin PilV [Salmonella enterica]
MAMKMKIKKGFSLLELTLVLGVGTMVAFMKFQDMKNEQESILASAVGQQMKQIGEAVNGYINIRYDKLSMLSNAAGNGSDPGPRTCSGNICEITSNTLINEGLLPSTFSGMNAQKSSYKILLKRDGISPNYVVNGLITTTLPWSEGAKIRYDLLGKAMLSAGVDSGMTKSATVASGYEGQWSEKSSDFSNITSEGLLSYRTGFNSAMYSVYLRRDGTLPMTGDLNMGGNDINNAKNITASGSGDFGGELRAVGNITSGKQFIGHNGGGDTFYIGGDANDYEFRLGTNKPLTLWRNEGLSNEQRLQVWGRQSNIGDLFVRGDKNSQGDITASGNITAGNWLVAHNGYGDSILFGGDAADDYEIAMVKDKPLSIHMVSNRSDLTALKITGNTSAIGKIEASGNIKGNTLESIGRTTVGEFVQVNGVAIAGASCSPNGLQGRSKEGSILSCVNGTWESYKNSYFDYDKCYNTEEDSPKPDYAQWGSGSNGFAVCDGRAGYTAAGFRAYHRKDQTVWVTVKCCQYKQ